MDLNIKSELVWDYYREVLKKLALYGVKIVRLDAFAYAPKEPGEKEDVQPVVELPEQSESTVSPKSTELGKRKRKIRGDYDGHFFNRVDFTYRKPLYITANTHRRLMRIVHLMDSSKATISSYVENILCHHLEVFKDDIDNIYRNNNLNPTEE